MKTNIAHLDIDFESFNARHQIWNIETTGEGFKNGAALLDSDCFGKGIRSLYISARNHAYIMLDAEEDAQAMLRNAIEKAGDDTVSIAKLKAEDLPQATLLNLMLNSLAAPWHDLLRFNNITGHLYCVNEANISRQNGKVRQVHAIEIRAKPQMQLCMHVRTFTLLRLKKHFGPSKRDAETLPRYVLKPGGSLRRTFGKADDALVMRQLKGRKKEIPFLSIGTQERFEASKMGCLHAVTELFHEKFDTIATLRFTEFDELTHVKTKMNLKWHAKIGGILAHENVSIVDCIGSDISDEICEESASYIRRRFNLNATARKTPRGDDLVLYIVHDKDNYQDDPDSDPYKVTSQNGIYQHVTIESLPETAEFSSCAVLDSCMKELAIKRDVANKHIDVIDWAEVMDNESMTFGIRVPHEDEDSFFFLTIDSKGDMTFISRKWDPEDGSIYVPMITAFSENACMMVANSAGDINFILETELYAVPDYEEIARLFRDEGRVHRRNTAYDTFLHESVNVSFAQTEASKGIYYVGQVGTNINTKIPRAARIREVVATPGSALFLKDALCLMDVDFVRTNMLTVIPFPFKHLREWMRTEGFID